MIHILHDRPAMRAKVYDQHGAIIFAIDASGDAWGDGSSGPWGHDYPVPPGHYLLTAVERFDPIPSEGFGQIDVSDLTEASVDALVKSGKAFRDGKNLTIGGVQLPFGELAAYGRSGVMWHGGGSNLGAAALDDVQELLKTYGCTRVHNADWKMLAAKVEAWLPDETIVVSAIGIPKALAG